MPGGDSQRAAGTGTDTLDTHSSTALPYKSIFNARGASCATGGLVIFTPTLHPPRNVTENIVMVLAVPCSSRGSAVVMRLTADCITRYRTRAAAWHCSEVLVAEQLRYSTASA